MDALSTIRRLAGSHMLTDLAEALTRTAGEVIATGSPGSVTVKLVVKPLPQGGDVALEVAESISRTTPKRKQRGAIFYLVDGELHTEDVRQRKLDFQVVEPVQAEIREAGDDRPSVREA